MQQQSGHKLSRYNYRIQLSEQSDIIYNPISDRVVAIRHECKTNSADEISDALFVILQSNGMIVDSDIDEVSNVFEQWCTKADSSAACNIIINPTLRCNFNCWYCYETHKGAPIMNKYVYEKTLAYIDSKFTTCKLLSISFFGGEPLLEYEKCVRPIIEHICNKSKEFDNIVNVSFTTNGYLLNADMIDFFAKHNVKYMQITLDGGRIFHNKTRIAPKGDSFNTILKNIERLLNNGICVTARINVTPENIDSCTDISDWISTLSSAQKKYLTVNVQQVWQTISNSNIYAQIDNLIETICDYGVYAYPQLLNNFHNMCYADQRNSVVINSDGSLFKCTAINFVEETAVSNLDSKDIQAEIDASLNANREKRLSDTRCRECKYLPLCMGGCYKTVKNRRNGNNCSYQENPAEMERRILDIVKDKIRRQNLQDNKTNK